MADDVERPLPQNDEPSITADEFERGYAERSGVTVERLRQRGRIVVPCKCCDYDECKGWKSISRAAALEDAVCVNCGEDDILHDARGCKEYKPYVG